MKTRETSELAPRLSRTLWTNLAENKGLKYYVANAQTMNAFYLHISDVKPQPSRVSIMSDSSEQHTASNNFSSGNVANQLEFTNDPFSEVKHQS